MADNCEMLIEKIATSAGLAKEEVERKIEARRAKLSGLISREGACQIIAAELGVNFNDMDLKITELVDGMRKVNIIARVITMFPVREFNKNNRVGKVSSFIVADQSGNMRVVLWDTNHIELVEKGDIIEGVVIEVKNAAMRNNELHLSGFSEIKKSNKVLENVNTTRAALDKEIKDLQPGQQVKIRGTIVQMFNPRFFNVCPECGKKIVQDGDGYSCADHGRIQPKERSLINFVIDDGGETVRVVLFSEQVSKLIPEEELKDPAKILTFREEWMGTEVYIQGSVRKNQLFNEVEMNVSDIQKVDVEKLIAELEVSN